MKSLQSATKTSGKEPGDQNPPVLFVPEPGNAKMGTGTNGCRYCKEGERGI